MRFYTPTCIPLSELNFNKIAFTSLYKLRLSRLQYFIVFFIDIFHSKIDAKFWP